MKQLIITGFLAASLSACVVGHPSTDKNHSHVDTSSTRYDEYDPNYDYHDKTKHRNKRRLYEEHRHEDEYLDRYYDDRDYEELPKYRRY